MSNEVPFPGQLGLFSGKTVDDWRRGIRASLAKTAFSIIATGILIIACKDDVGYGGLRQAVEGAGLNIVQPSDTWRSHGTPC